MINETFDEVESILGRKAKKFEEYKQTLSKKVPQDKVLQDIYFLLLQASLFFGQGITVKKLIEITGASHNTVRSKIKSIPEEHIIQTTISRTHFYKLNLNVLR